MVIEVTQVVYADILFIINTYVTYALLRSTGFVARCGVSRARAALCSLLGGAFSFVALFENVSVFTVTLSRFFLAAVLIFAAYYPFEKKRFLRLVISFFLVNFVYAGLMFALWLLFAPRSMLFCAGIVYFDIDAITLVIYTAACYGIVALGNSLLKMKVPSGKLYDVSITYAEKVYTCRALLDTGNSLFEPFSSLPVMVCERSVFGEGFEIPDEKLRLVPCSSLSAESVLRAFKPECVTIKGVGGEFKAGEMYVALSEKRIRNSEFGALLHPQFFDDKEDINALKFKA